VFDTADIVRDAILRQLTDEFSAACEKGHQHYRAAARKENSSGASGTI
jgi:hypothetical protein